MWVGDMHMKAQFINSQEDLTNVAQYVRSLHFPHLEQFNNRKGEMFCDFTHKDPKGIYFHIVSESSCMMLYTNKLFKCCSH
jgi:hypothetical protein